MLEEEMNEMEQPAINEENDEEDTNNANEIEHNDIQDLEDEDNFNEQDNHIENDASRTRLSRVSAGR